MTVSLYDDLEYAGALDTEWTADATGELPGRGEFSGRGELPGRLRRGAHSSELLGASTDPHRYVYQRPVDAPRQRRARHAAPAGDEFGALLTDSVVAPYRAPTGWQSSGSSWNSSINGSGRYVSEAGYEPAFLTGSGLTATLDVETAEVIEEAQVPFAPPTTGGRLRFLTGKHVRLRIAAASVLFVGSTVGVAVGVLHGSTPDKVAVTQDAQADLANPAVPTPDANPSQTQSAPVGAQLLVKQSQQAAAAAAQRLAISKAAAARAAAARAAARAAAQQASRSQNRTTTTGTGTSGTPGTVGKAVPTAPAACNAYSGNRLTGCAILMVEFNQPVSEMSCLDKLWTKESDWSATAYNANGGATGIPQSLPASKMASIADDYLTNPATQIRWGLGYIKGRYGNPCTAWTHSQNFNWY